MKKITKRLTGLLLVVVMLVSLCCITAFAEDNGAITVTNAVNGQTYKLYKLFNLESYDAQANAYSYTITAKWRSFFEGDGARYVNIDEQGYVTAKTGFDATTAAAFAKAALAWANANNIEPDVEPQTKGEGTVSFTGLPLGYYLLDSSLGTLCSLTTTKPTQEVVDKNGTPTIDKEVQENPGSSWGKWNDATIGDTINYKVTITGQEGAQKYIVHDTMQDSLDFIPSSVKVETRDTEVSGDKYTLVQDPEDVCTFEIVFSDAFCDSIVDDEIITVTYSAKLNSKALVYDGFNKNDVYLSYGENSRTEKETVKTYTYKAQIVKTTNEAAGNKVLTGAEFTLYYASDDKEIQVYKVSDGLYRPVTDPQTQTAVNIEAGTPVIEGLDAGVYYLKEEVAPDGYNKLAGKSQFEIKHNASGSDAQDSNLIAVLSDDGTAWVSGGVRVINQTGSEMPETGATGTMLFIAIGAVLALGGYIFLVSKKRLDAEMNG